MTYSFSPGSAVTIEKVEALLATLPHPSERPALHCDFSQLRFVEMGAGPRLAITLAAWSANLEVTLPRESTATSFFSLDRTAIRMVLMLTCREDGRERGESRLLITPAAAEDVGTYGFQIAQLHDRALRYDDPEAFALWIHSYFSQCGRDEWTFLAQDERREVIDALFELVQNVGDHAFSKPWSADRVAYSYAAVTFYSQRITSSHHDMFGTLRNDYLSRVRHHAKTRGTPLTALVEIVVADDGCSVAGRHAEDETIWRDPDREARILESAILEGGTSSAGIKMRAGDARVRRTDRTGYPEIRSKLAALSGHLEVRSGTSLLSVDGTSGTDTPQLAGEHFARLPGTMATLIVPIFTPQLAFLPAS